MTFQQGRSRGDALDTAAPCECDKGRRVVREADHRELILEAEPVKQAERRVRE